MIDITTLRAMATAGASVEVILAAVEAELMAEGARVQARRFKDAERQSRRREAGATISAELRIAVYERDRWECVYCGSEERLTCDHEIPVKKGGETTLENLVTACLSCNSKKQDRDRKVFERALEREGKSRPVQGQSRNSTDIQNQGDPALILSSPSLLVDSPKESIREVRTEVVEGQEKKKVSREAKKTHLSDEWKPNEKHYAKEKKFGHPAGYVDQKADDMRNWAKSKAIMRADWDATFHGFIRPKETVNGFGGPRPLQDDSKSISRAAGRLEEAARRGEFTFGPRPSLLPEPNENTVRLLSKG